MRNARASAWMAGSSPAMTAEARYLGAYGIKSGAVMTP